MAMARATVSMVLSSEQQAALEQLEAITASTSQAARDRDERILRQVGWNVQVAVEQIFSLGSAEDEMEPAPGGASASASGKGIAQMEVDDSTHRPRASSGSGLGGRARTGSVGLGLWRTVAWPVNFVLGVLWGGWYYLIRTFLPLSFLPYLPRTLLPPSHSTSSTHATQSSVPQDPESCAKRFIESLERPTGGEHPTFYQGGYKDCLALARTEGKVVCVVLCCAEHEDDEAFKTDVLADQELIRTFEENDMIVWGGDIRDREAYQVSKTLLITTFPSLTFISLLPPPASASNTSRAPRLTILTSLSGPPSSTTSTSQILQTISNSILPRTSTFLARLKREKLVLEEGRRLRMEQDQAFRAAEERDRAKIMKKRQEREAAEREERERSQAAEKAQAERKEAERKEGERKEKTVAWRRYARKHLLPAEPPAGEKPLRVGLRLPHSPTRHVRFFAPDEGTTTKLLYIYAETLVIPDDLPASSDPDSPPDDYDPASSMDAFRICTSFPRKEVPRDGGPEAWALVKEMGGALVLEVVPGRRWGPEGLVADDSESDSDDE